MGALPKRKHSTYRKGKRRGSIQLAKQTLTKTEDLPHRIKSDGTYKGVQIIPVSKKPTSKKQS